MVSSFETSVIPIIKSPVAECVGRGSSIPPDIDISSCNVDYKTALKSAEADVVLQHLRCGFLQSRVVWLQKELDEERDSIALLCANYEHNISGLRLMNQVRIHFTNTLKAQTTTSFLRFCLYFSEFEFCPN